MESRNLITVLYAYNFYPRRWGDLWLSTNAKHCSPYKFNIYTYSYTCRVRKNGLETSINAVLLIDSLFDNTRKGWPKKMWTSCVKRNMCEREANEEIKWDEKGHVVFKSHSGRRTCTYRVVIVLLIIWGLYTDRDRCLYRSGYVGKIMLKW